MESKSLEDRVLDQLDIQDEPEDAPEPQREPVKATSADETDEGDTEVAGQDDDSENAPKRASSDEDGEDESESQEPEVFEVEVDGELYEVPKSVKERIEQGTDYTKKTQALSAERKEFEIVRSQLQQSQKQYEFANSIQKEAGELQTLDWQIQQANQYLKDNLKDLSDRDILTLRMQIDDASKQRGDIEKSLQSKFSEFQQAQEQAQRELLDKSTEVLRSKIPNWDKVRDDVVGYVKGLGFTDHDVNIALSDPRQVQLAHDAMKYRQLKDKTTAAVKKVESAPIKPKSRDPMPERVKTQLNLRKQRKAARSNRDRERFIQEEMAQRLGL